MALRQLNRDRLPLDIGYHVHPEATPVHDLHGEGERVFEH